MLSQSDTKKFMETGEYCWETFDMSIDGQGRVMVGKSMADRVEGKQGYAIRETPEMYGARLLEDITVRPGTYFQQRAVMPTDAEIQAFAGRLPMLADQIRYVEKRGIWLQCKGACNSTYRCKFYDLCRSGIRYQPGDPAPAGYKLGYGSTPAVPNFKTGTEIRIGE
jgi:hypothetical protein